ncbi:hypothetical protein [Capybara microvirus Cap3_SP_550]|nr:hypothetical protein [Capybara microvirus Cap3_SP_550]
MAQKIIDTDGVVNKLPEYGTPGYIFELAWHDEAKKDYLVVVDAKPEVEVMNARAKGVTPYDLISTFGGIDEVTQAFASKEASAVYADVSGVPEFASDDVYDSVIARLKADIAAYEASHAKTDESSKETAEEVDNEVNKEVNKGESK